ncbi:MAG: gamma-glutamylcyclotransferase, partial [Deltaproteobacteria bacterium]|nr:gamma-glutamylcyclotransferase [Deltaproteobacteria bacterium]
MAARGREVINRLFVYGTLREGHAAASMIADHVVGSEPATTSGRIVAFADGYPGMVEDSRAEVIGELLTIGDLAPALALIDAYEGDDFARTIK